MTIRSSLPFWLCLIVSTVGCSPKQPSPGPARAERATVADTARPVLPTRTNWPLNPTLVTVPYDTSYKNFRDVFSIQFDDSTSAVTIRAFMARFHAVIIGGFGHGTSAPAYVVRVPDPGTKFEAVDSLEKAMGAHTGVKRAMVMNYEGSLRLKRSD